MENFFFEKLRILDNSNKFLRNIYNEGMYVIIFMVCIIYLHAIHIYQSFPLSFY